MAVHWRPVGPESEQTYWVRRAVAAAAAVVVLIVLIALVLPGGSDSARPSTAPGPDVAAPRPSPTTSSSVVLGPTAAATPSSAAAPCDPQQLTIAATVATPSYPVGGRPRFTLSVTSTAGQPCTVDLGQAVVGLVVTSGSDRIWSSDDCAPGGPALVTTLRPGTPDTRSVTWAGTRSRPGCGGAQEQAKAGTYRVSGRVGQQRVDGDVFTFTG